MQAAAAMLLECWDNTSTERAAALLSNCDTVATVASALASLVKRAAACLKAAGAAQAAAGAPPAANTPELASYCFPAIVPILHNLTADIVDVKLPDDGPESSASTAAAAAAAGGALHPSSNSSSSSTDELQQCRARLMLLAVLVARSLVVLADAMEAAAAAAGMTAPQLFARCVTLVCHGWSHTTTEHSPIYVNMRCTYTLISMAFVCGGNLLSITWAFSACWGLLQLQHAACISAADTFLLCTNCFFKC
jgi:hypothetical protein